MSNKKPTKTPGPHQTLPEAISIYEDATFGTIAPDDLTKPCAMLSAYARIVGGYENAVPPEYVLARMLLLSLVIARRCKCDDNQVWDMVSVLCDSLEEDAAMIRDRRENDAAWEASRTK